jgi:hypothetical protein
LLDWALLLSAVEAYDPRSGLTETPGWAERVNGKWVRISGFLAAPTVTGSTDEVLLMRNEWDGCCIGVPPTPYDSVEVRLDSSVALAQHRLHFGDVAGRFHFDPYLWKDWLVSLYVLEDARIAQQGL